jgi:hypothetical protein
MQNYIQTKDKYIIYDDISKTFKTDITCYMSFLSDGTINCFNGFGETKYFKYLGIKDINELEIYENSSIVELEYLTNTWQKAIGYFTYDVKTFSYILMISKSLSIHIGKFQYRNIKIVDTIQENKLKLF